MNHPIIRRQLCQTSPISRAILTNIAFIMFIFIPSLLNSSIWHIKQDGSGDFTTIQEGINVAVDADTILVYPGTYYENVDFLSKSLILGSLYLTTGNEDYISQTIIDGNQTGSCVEVRNCIEDYTTIIGFTLTNGSGSQSTSTNLSLIGGGILIKESIINILSCIIKDNHAQHGGGISCKNSNVFVSKTIISHNRAFSSGGGVSLISSSEVIFDDTELNSIFLNYAARGSEIFKINCSPMELIIDTFTVISPDKYFIESTDSFGNTYNDIQINILNSKLQPVNSDIYVSTEGSNNNSGLSPEDPLATINYAYSIIQPDSSHDNTIFLADGIYSTSQNDQWFPLQMRGHINLVGESMENTILDAENLSPIIDSHYSEFDFIIKNLNLVNGYGVFNQASGSQWILCFSDILGNDHEIQLENIQIHNCEGSSRLLAIWFLSATINNVHFYDNTSNSGSIDARAIMSERRFEITNFSEKNSFTRGIGIHEGPFGGDKIPVTLTNIELTDNLNPDGSWATSTCGISFGYNYQVEMINCTIGVNAISTTQGGPINLTGAGTVLNIYNSILYGNYPRNIWIGNDNQSNPNIVNIYNSLIEDGEDSCQSLYPWDEINFIENNLVGNTDPLWLNSGEYPYQLAAGSPCIDAGTLNWPPGIGLPEFDLAGNPRIYGNTIDMGAYEWQGVGIEEPEIPQLSPLTTHLLNYPNPFNPSTTIKLELAEAGKIELAVYNIKGQKVKTLLDCTTAAGTFNCIWNGRDSGGKRVASGEYIVKLKVNGEETAVRKIMLVK